MSVESYLQGKLNELAGVCIKVNNRSVDVLEALKHTPRTGKSCRIDAYKLGLPKRSLFDHLPSMAVQADLFKKYAKTSLSDDLLADLIAFHDWHEVIIGDVPEFTPKELAGNLYMTAEEKQKRQAAADKLILQSLSGNTKEQYVALDELFHKPDQFFLMVDKTDPIIAIWRYLHLFKDQIDIEKFLDAMTHFFTNPKVVPTCFSEDIASFIKFLQNKDNARAYFKEGLKAFAKYKGAISLQDIQSILEKREMHFIE